MRTALLFLCAIGVAIAQGQPTPNRVEIRVEQKEAGAIKQVDPAHIFKENDLIHFKVKANFSGYLYVMDQGTSGKYVTLFPGEDIGRTNRIEKGKEYTIPSPEVGWFKLEGPAGHDVVYWVVSPVELTASTAASIPAIGPVPPQNSQLPADITPRCDDTVFKAQGDCVDTSAGARPVAQSETVPQNLSQFSDRRTADLLFLKQQKVSTVSSPEPLSGPIIYEFHVAHK
jgi:hypothetical protein